MAYCPAYKLSTYDVLPDEDKAAIMRALVGVLVVANCRYLKRNPQVPSIYATRVRYVFNYDSWKDVPAMLEDLDGDCKDLSAWRIAELLNQGFHAEPDVIHRQVNTEKGPLIVYHVRVRIYGPDGHFSVEDPSRWAGMPETGGVAPGMGI